MSLKNKTKEELIAEIEKLQQQLKSLETNKLFPGLSVIQKYEKSLTNEKDFNQKIVDITDFGTWEIDILTKKIKCNSIFSLIFDLKENDDIDKNQLYKKINQEDLFLLKENFNKLRLNQVENFEQKLSIQINDKKRWVLLKAIYFKSEKSEKFIGFANDITKEIEYQEKIKQTENEIRQSEQKFRSLSESSPVGIFFSNYEGRVEYYNQKILEIAKVDKSYFSDFKWLELVHKEDIEKLQSEITEAIVLQKSYSTIFRVIRTDGKNIWVNYLAQAFRERDKFLGWIGIVTDITEQKHYEEALKKSEKKLENILSNFNGMIYRVRNNKNWSTLYLSKGVEKLTGHNTDTIKNNQNFSKFIYEKDKDFVKKEISKAIKNNKPYSLEYRILNKKGELVWVHEQGQAIYEDSSKVFYLEGFIYDITERKRSEENLRKSEEKYRNLVEKIQEEYFFYSHDTNGVFNYLSSSFQTILGYEVNDFLINVKEHPLTENPVNAKALKYTEMSIKGLKAPLYEVEIFHKNGSKVNLEILEAPIFDEFGKVIRVEGIAKDITVKKQYEEELKNSYENFKRLIQFSPVGMAIIQDEKVVFLNEKAIKIFGFDDIEIYNNISLWDLVPEEYKEIIRKRYNKAFENNESQEFLEIKVKNKKGEFIEIETSPMPVIFNGKNSLQVVIQDISDRKKLQREQMRSEIAEETNKFLQEEIANRLKAERQLIEAQNFTNSIIYCSLDIIIATDKHGKILEFNEAAQNIFGYTLEEIKNADLSILYNESSELEKIRKELDTKGSFVGETQNRRKNGEIFTSFISASTLINDKKETIGFMAVSRDITKEKEAEEILKASENRFSALFMQAPFSIEILDENGSHVKVNNKFEALFGMSLEDSKLIKYNINEDKNLKDLGLYNYFRKGYLGESSFIPTSKTVINKNGSEEEVWLSRYIYPIVNNKKITELIVIHINETEKKQRERKIQEQAAKIKAIIDNSSHKIWSLNTKYEVTSFNKNYFEMMQRLLGVKVQVGSNMLNITKEFTNKEFFNKIHQVHKNTFNGKTEYFEAPFYDLNKNKIWMEIYLSPIIVANGEIEEISCIAQDITEKKNAEYKLKASLNEKEVLLKEVHHRVKNNLQVISSILNLQSAYVKDKNTLNIIKESQNRVKTMAFIHQSLYQTKDFSKINFSTYVENLSKNLVQSYRIDNKIITLLFNVEKEIFLELDFAIPCGLIINELMSNALKYAFTESLKEKGTIKIQIFKNEKQIYLSLEDNGIGLPTDFDLKNTKSLGLQLVTSLVGQLDANLTYKSEPNNGTIFKVNFSTE
jgi:PAS domain S-box-containing protein